MQRDLRLFSMLELGVLVLALGACGRDAFFDNATQFAPPNSYRLDWRIVEYCSGVTGNFDAVTWYKAPGSAAPGLGDALGAFYPEFNSIVLREGYALKHEVVRHEILHALRPRVPGHDTYFTINCRGHVLCSDTCAREAGGWGTRPSSGSRTLPPDSLDVSALVLPYQQRDSGYVALIVTAKNPRDEAVWIDLSAMPRNEFRCVIDLYPCGRVFNFASETASFVPNETRSAAFIVHLNLPGMTTTLTGAFNTKAAPPIAVAPP